MARRLQQCRDCKIKLAHHWPGVRNALISGGLLLQDETGEQRAGLRQGCACRPQPRTNQRARSPGARRPAPVSSTPSLTLLLTHTCRSAATPLTRVCPSSATSPSHLHPRCPCASACVAMARHEPDEPAMAPENPFESPFDDDLAVPDPVPADHGSGAAVEPRDRSETRTTPSQVRSSSGEPGVRRSISLSPPDAKRPTIQSSRSVQQRSSIAKNRDLFPPDQQRLSSRDRLSRAIADGTPRQSTDSPRRSSSRASSYAPYDRSNTPFNGPSHPYGMYPQTGVARTASVATSSTIRRPPSTPQPHSSPSHPYGLYQQNSLPVADDGASAEPLPAIQIGFLGSNAGFHRQLGPDGEEQDIIGPDGHTEQLPPYSKYPNENEKAYAAMAAVPNSPTPSHESQNTLVPSPERQLSNNERPPSETADSGTTVAASEKSWKDKNWKERRKTRVCGVFPCWLVMVALGCLTFIGVVLGGVIGGFLAKEKEKSYDTIPSFC